MGFLTDGLWIKAKAVVAQVLLDRAFTETVATGKPVKPWSWADTWPVARISVPRLGESAIVAQKRQRPGNGLRAGPSRSNGGAGERGTAVFAAHRDTHFAFLGDVVPGDRIVVTRDDGLTFTYEVTGSEVVRFDHSGIDANASGRWLALATCWPLDGTFRGPMRYVVHARMIEGRQTAGL